MGTGRRTQVSLRQILSEELLTVGPETSLRGAAQTMVEHGAGSVVAMEGGRGVAGILTERDILRAVGTNVDLEMTRIDAVMTRGVVAGAPDWDLVQALGKMSDGGFRHLLVMEEDHPVGIVSMRDVMVSMAELEQERIEDELRTAQLIQRNFLPKELPRLPGWELDAYYQAMLAVGGDLYDFIELPGGLLAVVVGDVSGHGIPAALMMASTRGSVRAAARDEARNTAAGSVPSPGTILEQANQMVLEDILPNMFVTCLCAVLDPGTGRLQVANAGQNPPYLWTEDGIVEVWATGMPLGLMPGTRYVEESAEVAPGNSVLFSSDGIIEAHNPAREMFGFPRVREVLASQRNGDRLIAALLSELSEFTGPDWEPEDDVTLVTLQRTE